MAARARVAEARAAVVAQRRLATRLRRDAARLARGDAPPALAVAREQWQQQLIDLRLAQQDQARTQLLVSDGAVARQQLDQARGRAETAARRAAEAQMELAAAGKSLRESVGDAEAELTRRRAALDAARAMEAAARANEAAASEAARLVIATSMPAQLATARQRALSADVAVDAARVGRRELLAQRTEILMKQQEADRLEAQIAVIQDQLRRSVLTAPCDGVVTTPRVAERVGASFGQGAIILEIEDPTSLFTRIFVNEKDLGDVRVGQKVELRVAAYSQRRHLGRVSEIAPRAVPGGSAAFPTNTVEVRLQVENPTGELRSGMSGWAKIHCGRRPLGAILLRRAARYLRTEVWSWF
jgi:putative peptide zinc metalloprotease protein